MDYFIKMKSSVKYAPWKCIYKKDVKFHIIDHNNILVNIRALCVKLK